MKLFRIIRHNLDVYLTVAAAITVSALSYFNIVDQKQLSSLTLAVLAILAVNSLVTRALFEAGAPTFHEVLRREFPADLVTRREQSNDVYLIGVSLERTIETSYEGLSQLLRRGGRLRVLLTDPGADAAALDARSQLSRPSPDEMRSEIRSSLDKLTRMAKATKGNIEVRLTGAALKYGANVLDGDRPRSVLICIQFYSYRSSGESGPIVVLRPADGEWFERFRAQTEALWADAATFDVVRGEVTTSGNSASATVPVQQG